MQMAPWLQLLLMRNFEFHHKKSTFFSNPIGFLDFDGNFEKKNFEKFFPQKMPLGCPEAMQKVSGQYLNSFRHGAKNSKIGKIQIHSEQPLLRQGCSKYFFIDIQRIQTLQ